jgi:tRNA threonylcarbamoyladenosine biosynthesis protein TsaE
MTELLEVTCEAELDAFGRRFVQQLKVGNIVLLSGPLGAGKTTLVRSMLRTLGWGEAVRSPTYNLIHLYNTEPPVMHADLYRLESAKGVGLEEYSDSHLCFIEWPDRLSGQFDLHPSIYRVDIGFGESPEARLIQIKKPPSAE